MKAELYLAADGWRGRLVARNGRILWVTSESYRRRRDALHALELLLDAAATGKLAMAQLNRSKR